jgi:hypothetical protein
VIPFKLIDAIHSTVFVLQFRNVSIMFDWAYEVSFDAA